MLTIETNNPDIDVDDLMRRVDEEAKKIKRKSLPFREIVFSVHNKYGATENLPPIELKEQYHINELIGLQGDHFVVSAYRAIIQDKPDPEIITHYKTLFDQGVLNKKELLCRLRYSPSGKKKGIVIKGLLVPRIVGNIFNIPVLGSFCRVFACIVRLPVLFRNIQRMDRMLVACQNDLQSKVNAEDYNRNLKRISMAFQMTEQKMTDLLQDPKGKNF